MNDPRAQKTSISAMLRYTLVRRSRPAVAAVFLGLCAQPALADIDLIFGTYAADKPTETVRKFKPFLDHVAAGMSEILGEPVSIKMKIAKEYEESIDHLATGAIDFSRFGPASYITAHALNSDIQIVAMELKKGEKRFKGVIAVHADSNIETLQDLAQRSFAFGDELSTIGRYLAQSHLIEAGVYSQDLERFEFLGRHDRVGAAVGAGNFTAGALKESTFKKMVQSGVPIKALFKFDNVTKPWLASSNMSPEVLSAMQQVIMNTTDPEILGSIAKDGFTTGADTDYDFVRDAMERSRMF